MTKKPDIFFNLRDICKFSTTKKVSKENCNKQIHTLYPELCVSVGIEPFHTVMHRNCFLSLRKTYSKKILFKVLEKSIFKIDNIYIYYPRCIGQISCAILSFIVIRPSEGRPL